MASAEALAEYRKWRVTTNQTSAHALSKIVTALEKSPVKADRTLAQMLSGQSGDRRIEALRELRLQAGT